MSVFVGDFKAPSAVNGALWVLSQTNPSRAEELSFEDANDFLKDLKLDRFSCENLTSIWMALNDNTLGLTVPELVFYSLSCDNGSALEFLKSGKVDPKKFSAIHAKGKWVVVGPELARTKPAFLRKLTPTGGNYSYFLD